MTDIRLNIVAAAYALWLTAVLVIFYLAAGNNETALQLVVMCGLAPALCQMSLLGFDSRGLAAPMKMWLALLLVILLSYVVNMMDPRTAPGDTGGVAVPPAWAPVVYTLNTLFILGLALLVAGCPDRRLLRSIGGQYAILAALVLLYVDMTGEMVWGRLRANDIESNWWGLMGMSVCLGASARKLGLPSIAAFSIGVATILLASSREHMIAVAAIVGIIGILQVRPTSRPGLVARLIAACVCLVALMLLFDPYLFRAIDYVTNDLLLLDNPERGINSGFTGRSAIWAETFDLWLKSPIFGVGFRQHEQFLPNNVPAHNGYLAMLADTGLLGFIVFVVLLLYSLAAAWGIQDQRTRRLTITTILSQIIVAFFDRRTINGGNSFSLLFLMCCSVALCDYSLRRAKHVVAKLQDTREEALSSSSLVQP